MAALIPLGGRRGPRRGHAVIDDADIARVASRTWYLDSLGYPVSQTIERIRLHRLIMDPPAGFEVDHADGDKLNNQRSNLRLVTHQGNSQNVRTAKGEYRGVYFDRRCGKWYGQVKHNGVKHCVPYSDDREHVRQRVAHLRDELGFLG